ncbi:hypothetical protein [[Pseudomonas] boreopolis]|uniref:hypothetical protein n=1 Tax=Xanthomonas boreopolis TaxID=86183 RepID=UPI003DA0A5D2
MKARVSKFPFLAGCALAATLPTRAASAEDPGAAHLDIGGAVRFNSPWLDDGPTSRLQLELLRADLPGGVGPAFFSSSPPAMRPACARRGRNTEEQG